MKKFNDPIENIAKGGWLGVAVWLDSPRVSWAIAVVIMVGLTTALLLG